MIIPSEVVKFTAMEVLDSQETALTNYEVMKTLQQIRTNEGKRPKQDRISALNTVIYEVVSYVQSTPAAAQSEEAVLECIEKLRPFKLNPAETLQIINVRPSQQIDIELTIEESEERLSTQEQLDKLIQTITETLPARPVKKEGK